MFEEVRSCQSVMREHFNKPLNMTPENERDFKTVLHVIFVGENIKLRGFMVMKINLSEIIVILLVNIEVQPIMIAT